MKNIQGIVHTETAGTGDVRQEGTKMATLSTQENVLNIKVQYYNDLIYRAFHRLKDPSFCYKFYWLEAIVNLISEGITETTFDAIIDEMIANAWYSVREFHIHLSGLQADEWYAMGWNEQFCN